MASLIFQRASWRLQISRTSRLFSISFTTALPRRGHPRRLPSPSPLLSNSRSRRSSDPYHFRQAEARRAFTSTREQSLSPQEEASVVNDITPNAEDLSKGLNDQNLEQNGKDGNVDWTRSFDGLSREAFSPEASKVLLAPIDPEDVEIKSDGIIYLPEIKYRRILNQAFGPGGWGLAPRGETIVTSKAVTREYALVVLGRLVSVARGEQDYFSPEGIPTAVEGCKSTALRRCCKDLGIASELWDPRYIRKFMAQYAREVFVEHVNTKKKRKIFLRKEDKVQYPWKETR